MDIREPGAFFAQGIAYLLLLRCFLALAQHPSWEAQLCFWSGGMTEVQRHTGNYPEQWLQMQIIMPNPQYYPYLCGSLCHVLMCDLLFPESFCQNLKDKEICQTALCRTVSGQWFCL